MIVQKIYCGGRQVKRIILAHRIIWPVGSGELSLSYIADLFSNGFHAMRIGDAIVLTSNELVMSVPDENLSVLPPMQLNVDYSSKSDMDGHIIPVDAILCVCDAASVTQGEINTLVANAVTFDGALDIQTIPTLYSLIAEAISGVHIEDSGTTPEFMMLVPKAICGENSEDIVTIPEAVIEVVDAVYGVKIEDNESTSDASMDTAESVQFAAQSDNASVCEAHMVPLRVEQIAEMDVEAESQTIQDSGLDTPVDVEVTSHLHLVAICEAHLFVAPAAGMDAQDDSKTTEIVYLHFDGETPDEDWYDPIQTGNDLYIRSAYLFWQQDKRGYFTAVFYEPVQIGSDLYIRSANSIWTENDEANIDTEVFYTPVYSNGDLYIRSVDVFWTDGTEGNIDSDVYLSPVQDGSNLYIRQDIFGGE